MTSEQSTILLESGTNEVEFIEFYLGGKSYGVNVAKVIRVVRASELKVTPLDNVSDAILGLIYQRDEPITFLDMAKALNVKNPVEDDGKKIALIAHFNGTTTSYLVDGIHKIHRCSWNALQPIDDTLHGCHNSYCTGIVRIEGNPILILDLERLLTDFFNTSEKEVLETGFIDENPRRAKMKILFCEDSPAIRNLTIKKLKSHGYTSIQEFMNGQECYQYLQKAKKKHEQDGTPLTEIFDLILTDIEMPQMDGLTLCKQVKSNLFPKAKIPVIMYSSLINESMRQKCISVGSEAQVSKPQGQEIIKALDQFLV